MTEKTAASTIHMSDPRVTALRARFVEQLATVANGAAEMPARSPSLGDDFVVASGAQIAAAAAEDSPPEQCRDVGFWLRAISDVLWARSAAAGPNVLPYAGIFSTPRGARIVVQARTFVDGPEARARLEAALKLHLQRCRPPVAAPDAAVT